MRVCFWTSGRLEVDDRVVLDRAREGKFYGATCLFVIFWTESLVVLATGVRRVVGTDVDEIVSTVTLGGNAGLLAGDSFDLFCDGGWYVSEHTDLSALRPNGLSNGLQSEHRAAFVLNTTSVKLLGSQICKPVIHGFVGAACGIVLIARRVMDRSLGVRFRKRGAHHDSDFAANFVELEQISQTGNYVQLRGSVPLMWAQDFSGASFTPAIVESASPDHSRAAFDRHFDLLSSLYNGMEVRCVSLLKQHDDHEREGWLHRSFSSLLKGRVKSIEFDLHRECRSGNYTPLIEMVNSLDVAISPRQTVIWRTNCKDSVDRTGLLQAALFERVFVMQLQQSNLKETREIVDAGRAMMAACNNMLSLQYTGTLAVREEVLYSQQTSRLGLAKDRLIGFLRFYQNVYFDERKQRALEICVFGKPASVEAGQNVLYKLAPRLEKGFVSGPLHLFLIVLFVILFVLFLKPKLKAKK